MEEATVLTNFASLVTVVYRGDVLKASQAMQDKAKADPKIFEQDIRSTVFYRNKTKNILGAAKMLIKDLTLKELNYFKNQYFEGTNLRFSNMICVTILSKKVTSFTHVTTTYYLTILKNKLENHSCHCTLFSS